MKVPKFFRKKKRIVWTVIILVVLAVGGYFIFGRKNNIGTVLAVTAQKQDIEQTVLATGQVVSGTDLSLSFQSGGIVKKIYVQEGGNVSQGQTLAVLDQASQLASLTTAKGSLAQAQANYDKLVSGSTVYDIQLSQDSVESAKQDLQNIYNGASNTLNSAYTAIFNANASSKTIKDAYFSSYDPISIKVNSARNGITSKLDLAAQDLSKAKSGSNFEIENAVSRMISSLSSVYSDLSVIRAQCDEGVYLSTVAASYKTDLDTQKTAINTALANVTTLQNNIASYKLALKKAENTLAQTNAPPTQAEVDSAKAQVLSAQGQVESAQVSLNNTILKAPASGTITKVDIKVGEQSTALADVMVLQDTENLHAEANVSEANVASLELGQAIDYTFDALGPDEHFKGSMLTINPASTIVSGVVNYKIKGSLENVPKIKPGMTANMTILVAQKQNVLAVPSTAVINKENGRFVRVIDDGEKMTFHEAKVQTGLEADGGLVEIISGISEGEQVITYIK